MISAVVFKENDLQTLDGIHFWDCTRGFPFLPQAAAPLPQDPVEGWGVIRQVLGCERRTYGGSRESLYEQSWLWVYFCFPPISHFILSYLSSLVLSLGWVPQISSDALRLWKMGDKVTVKPKYQWRGEGIKRISHISLLWMPMSQHSCLAPLLNTVR